MRAQPATLLTALLISGCVTAQTGDHQASSPLPERSTLPLVEERLARPEEGSIYSSRSRNLYSDTRARAVGDIVLVKIVETSSGTKKATTKTSRDSSLTGGVSSLFGFERWFTGESSAHVPSLTSMQADAKTEFEGKGETKRDSTVTATLSARVVDIAPDGNLMIRGYREVRVNNETQHLILSGLVRPQDISKDNSILSSHIADARIEYNGAGALSQKQQPGWLSNTLDVIWPF